MKYEDVFYYDETSPSCLRWKVSRYSGRGYKRLVVSAGAPVGSVDSNGYYTTPFNGSNTRCHNIVAELCGLDVPDGYLVDHENRNRLDNRIGNLRVIKSILNVRNRKKHSNNSTGVTGVYRYTNTINGVAYNYYVAQWDELNGKRRVKRYNIATYGDAEAFRLATEKRSEMINKLNAEGAGYTSGHGT
jgi:hypothetical protein